VFVSVAGARLVKECFLVGTCSNSDRVELQKILADILAAIQRHSDSWPFLQPVSKDQAADYYEIIKDPIGSVSIFV
jgi:hypothetical protein